MPVSIAQYTVQLLSSTCSYSQILSWFIIFPTSIAFSTLDKTLGWRRSRVVTFTAIRLRGPAFKPRPGQKFENKNFCFRRTPAVVKACHPCRVRQIKTPLYKTWIPTYPAATHCIHPTVWFSGSESWPSIYQPIVFESAGFLDFVFVDAVDM